MSEKVDGQVSSVSSVSLWKYSCCWFVHEDTTMPWRTFRI